MSNVGTPIFAAPEVLRRQRYTQKADVWSFGCVLETLVTHAAVYAWFTPQEEVVRRVADGQLKPNLPAAHFLAEILERCVTPRADERPRFDGLVDMLSSSQMGLAAALQPPGPATGLALLQGAGALGGAPGGAVGPQAPLTATLVRPQASQPKPLPGWLNPAGASEPSVAGDADETGLDLADLEATWHDHVRESVWCAHLFLAPPLVAPAHLLTPEHCRLTALCAFKSAELERIYREHRFFRCASRARWVPRHTLRRPIAAAALPWRRCRGGGLPRSPARCLDGSSRRSLPSSLSTPSCPPEYKGAAGPQGLLSDAGMLPGGAASVAHFPHRVSTTQALVCTCLFIASVAAVQARRRVETVVLVAPQLGSHRPDMTRRERRLQPGGRNGRSSLPGGAMEPHTRLTPCNQPGPLPRGRGPRVPRSRRRFASSPCGGRCPTT